MSFNVPLASQGGKTSIAEPVVPYSSYLSGTASVLDANNTVGVKGAAMSIATSKAASTVQELFSQFGTAQVRLNVDSNGNWDNSSFDFLAPLYDNKKSVLFTQLGVRAPDGRTTGNVGIGVRTFYTENWMFGGNVFLDDDFTGKNRRVGFGAEAWTDYLKLGANTYVGTTDWHSSRDFDDYNEKPSDGYDIRAEGYLPAYPQLGTKLMYEQYYGDKVALFNKDKLQSNPSAITFGLNYTPVPLVTAAVDYRRGQDSMDETHFSLNFRYAIGQSWDAQISSDQVALRRSLAGSRYDLVDRNNEIVMQYRKKEQQNVSNLNLQIVTDNSPSDGITPNTAQVLATDKDGQPVRNALITWSASGSAKLATSTTTTSDSGVSTVSYTNTVAEVVIITAKSGAVLTSQNSHFNAVIVSNVTLKITTDNSVADGKTDNRAQATVTDVNGRPIPDSKVTWSVASPAVLNNAGTTTDSNGQVTTGFSSTTAGVVALTVTAGEKSASQQGHFVASPSSASIDTMTITRNGSPADGTTANSVTITVKDSSGTAVKNASVSLSADKSTVVFGAAAKARAGTAKSFQTDEQGSLTVNFTDTVPESVVLTAALDNGNTRTATANFVANNNAAVIRDLTVTSGAIANGVATNQATITVTDSNNTPLNGITVNWLQDGSAIFGSSAKTDANGKTNVTFTDIKAQVVNITATLPDGGSQTKPSEFIADVSTARLLSLTVTKDGSSIYGGTNTADAMVVDANNNPLAGQIVAWSSDKSTVILTPTNGGISDSSGRATVGYTDSAAESLVLTATINGSTLTKPSSFTDDAIISSISPTINGIQGDGTQTNEVTVIVKNAAGQLLSGKNIHWTMNSATASLQNATTTSGSDGSSQVRLTDTTGEDVTVTATLDNGQTSSTRVTFSQVLQLALSPASESGTAGVQETPLSVTATVTNTQGLPVSGVNVSWSTGSTDLIPSSNNGITGSNGQATFTFTSMAKGDFTPQASISSGSATVTQSVNLSFVEDTATSVTYSVTPAGSNLTVAELTNGFTFTVPAWKGMIKGQTVHCQYSYQDLGFNTINLSQEVVVDSSSWGNSVTLTTPAFPASDGVNRGGFLVCSLFSTNNGTIYVSDHTNVRVTN